MAVSCLTLNEETLFIRVYQSHPSHPCSILFNHRACLVEQYFPDLNASKINRRLDIKTPARHGQVFQQLSHGGLSVGNIEHVAYRSGKIKMSK